MTNIFRVLLGRTGFHRACFFRCKEVVEIIIRNSKSFDFDLTAQDCNGETGFQVAKKYGYSNITSIIQAKRPDFEFPWIKL